MKKKFFVFIIFNILTAYSFYGQQLIKSNLVQAWNEFQTPQDEARTKVWWFHGETETTREGITADLEAYKRVGVGGVVYYDQVHGKGKNALPAFSQEWWNMLKFSASEAQRLGLSFEANVSNGYVAGGPWITEEYGMQRLTASDTLVDGGHRFSDVLASPPHKNKLKYFRDVAVLAFPVPSGECETNLTRHPKLSSNLAGLNVESIFIPDNLQFATISPQKAHQSVYLILDFNQSFSARSITYKIRSRGRKATTGAMNIPGPPSNSFYGMGFQELPDIGQLEVSNDGINYRRVCDLKPIYKAASGTWNEKTISFPKVTGRYFRLNFHDWTCPNDEAPDLLMGNILLSSQAKIDQWEEKAGLYSEYIESDNTPEYGALDMIDPNTIINLSSKIDKDGKLEWDVPKGKWVIMRFAHVPTGGRILHGRSNLGGLECDKMSSKAAILQWNNYFKLILDTLTKANLALNGIIMDSNESGSQNWTPGFENQFKKRRGYDIHIYLPALMGYIVGSKQKTLNFLYDIRRTIADLVSDEYFGTFDSLSRNAGLILTAQAAGNGQSLVSDNIQAKGHVQKPQGEFWGHHIHGSYDVKESSSAAHIYGKKIASAEAFTDVKYSQSLADMKNLADFAYAFGVNEFVVCASAYQPWLNKIPGNTADGREYCLNRNNTYWNYSAPFWDYQARCAGLLRKGLPKADLCIYLGNNAPVKILTYRLPEIPEGFDFDVCTEDALTTRFISENRLLVVAGGIKYQMLVLEKKADITLQALRKIAALVKEGVPVYGYRPQRSESLQDNSYENEYLELADQLWGTNTASTGIQTFGKGKVYWGISLAEALLKEGIKPDMGVKSKYIPTDKIYFTHRKLEDADVYFINNHSNNIFNDSLQLRVIANNAEFWDPTTGLRSALPVLRSDSFGITVKMFLQPNESGFIVVNNQQTTGLYFRGRYQKEQINAITGEWSVYFDPKWGGPGNVIFPGLSDWSKNTDSRIRYYSGTAVYNKTIQLDMPVVNEQVLIRFPNLKSIARIFVNEKEVSTVWCSPWEADITSFIQSGQNKLEIQVVNSLQNRMIGDASLPLEKRFTFAYPEIVTAKNSLVRSGIIDEVLIVHRLN